MSSITEILTRIEAGEAKASADLLPLVYEELRQLASARLSAENPGQTLQPTALVHEAYVRMVEGQDQESWAGKGHFFAAAAISMRRILVENARRKASLRRGGQFKRVQLGTSNEPPAIFPSDDVLALHEALELLAEKDSRKARLVELRCFAGLTIEKAAGCLGISTATAQRDWAYARAWLHQKIAGV